MRFDKNNFDYIYNIRGNVLDKSTCMKIFGISFDNLKKIVKHFKYAIKRPL